MLILEEREVLPAPLLVIFVRHQQNAKNAVKQCINPGHQACIRF